MENYQEAMVFSSMETTKKYYKKLINEIYTRLEKLPSLHSDGAFVREMHDIFAVLIDHRMYEEEPHRILNIQSATPTNFDVSDFPKLAKKQRIEELRSTHAQFAAFYDFAEVIVFMNFVIKIIDRGDFDFFINLLSNEEYKDLEQYIIDNELDESIPATFLQLFSHELLITYMQLRSTSNLALQTIRWYLQSLPSMIEDKNPSYVNRYSEVLKELYNQVMDIRIGEK